MTVGPRSVIIYDGCISMEICRIANHFEFRDVSINPGILGTYDFPDLHVPLFIVELDKY